MPPLSSRDSVDLLQSPSLAAVPWLRHAFSARAGGVSIVYGQPNDLNLGFTAHDKPEAVLENRGRLLAETASASWPLLTARQIHTSSIHTVTALPQIPIEADALTTSLPGVFLGILTADCVSILLADTRLRVVAAVHAGWRGTAARILEHTVQALRDRHHCDPNDILAVIGPSIGPCCYEVGEEVQTAFHHSFPYASELFQGHHLDLWQANRRQLLTAGLPSANITIENLCTSSTFAPSGHRRFFSHRAEHGRTGRMMSLIGIDPEIR